MAHFAIIAPPLRGHYRPLSFLATELIDRGHRVTFVHQKDAAAFVDAEGAGFERIGEGAEAVERWTQPMSRIRGLIGLGRVTERMERFTTMFCREAPALLRRLKVDAVIADQLEPGGGLVAEHLGLPWISTATTMPMNREPGVPPPFVGWRYDGSPSGVRRNAGGWRVSDVLLRGFGRVISREAQELGLPPRRRMEDCFSPILQLSQIVPGLDFPRDELPASFHHTGPFRGADASDFELPPSDGRPTVYSTLGTLQGSRVSVFRKIAEACDTLGLRLVITVGQAENVRSEDLPGDPLVYDWVPQESVIARADLVVSHAGMNSVLDPLAAGKPMVVMPLAFEQPGIAARVAYSGSGIALSRRASAQALADAIKATLEQPTYRTRAEVLKREIEAAGGVGRAADLIEQTFGVGARPEAATTAPAERGDVRGGSRSGSS